jgi:flagellar basal-body rod modification protein FlgD
MASAIAGFTPTTPPASSSSSTLNGMNASDFLNLMITQLQQQDPMNPTDSNQLLTQMSQISTLQSNTQMASSLQSLTLQQSIGAAGNLIGKSITGLDDSGAKVNGIVTSVSVQNSSVYLTTDTGSTLPMKNLTGVSATAGANDAIAAALPNLQQYLQNIAGSSGSSASALAQYLPMIQQYLSANGSNPAALAQAASAIGM